jgi:membrane protease YdiL (CAAX protease family)
VAQGTAVSDAVKSWGIFSTFAFGAIALIVSQLSGIVAVSEFYGLDLKQIGTISRDGGGIILFICVSAPIQVALLVTAASYKSNPVTYLGYKLPRRGEVLFGIGALAALILTGDLISLLAGRSVVDPFQSDIYQAAQKANLLPLLLFAICILIPVSEESLFRGFLFRGWLQSPRSAWLVIVLTAGLFAVIHVQYDWFLIGQVFAFGVLFGWMRWVTGSTLLTMLLHGLVNLEGMIETLLSVSS